MPESRKHIQFYALRKLVQNALWKGEVLSYDFAVLALSPFPIDKVSAAFGTLFQTLGPLSKRHKFAEKSMKIAFPHSTAAQRKIWLSEMWNNMGRMLGEFLCLKRFAHADNQHEFDIEIHPETQFFVQQKYPVIFFSGHFANWEMLPITSRKLDYPCQITYRAMNNPYFDKRLKALRKAIGIEFLTPKSGIKGALELVQTLKQGRSLFFMGDQKYNEGLAVPFFGKKAMTQIAPLRLALKTGTPIIPILNKRMKGIKTKLILYKPLYVGEITKKTHRYSFSEQDIYNLAVKLNQFYENRICEAPGEWFWLHRRWPKSLYSS